MGIGEEIMVFWVRVKWHQRGKVRRLKAPEVVRKKQSTARNHGIQFKDQEQRNVYNSQISRTISTCRYPDVNVMDRLGIDEHVIRLLNS